MKKLIYSILTIASAMSLASCGGSKTTDSNNSTVAAVEEAAEPETFEGETYSKEAAEFYLKKNFGVKLEDMTPSYQYDESSKYTYKGERRSASATFKPAEGATATLESIKEAATKLYNATKAVADDNKCIYGFEEFESKEEALKEKSLEEVLKGKSFMGIQIDDFCWCYVKNGNIIRCNCTSLDDNKGYAVELYYALQKSFDDTLEEGAKKLDEMMSDPDKKKEADKVLEKAGLK